MVLRKKKGKTMGKIKDIMAAKMNMQLDKELDDRAVTDRKRCEVENTQSFIAKGT